MVSSCLIFRRSKLFGTGGSVAPAAADRLRSRRAGSFGDQARRASESFLRACCGSKSRLVFLYDLVRKRMPDVVVGFFCREVKFEFFYMLRDLGFYLLRVGNMRAVGGREDWLYRPAGLMHKDKSRDIPDLGREIPIRPDFVLGNSSIFSGSVAGDERHPHCIRAVGIGNAKGVDHVAF